MPTKTRNMVGIAHPTNAEIFSKIKSDFYIMIKVLLVDEQQDIQNYLTSLIEKEADLKVVGIADNGKTAILQVAELHPDVVVMDVDMPEMDGVNATKMIRERFPNTKVLVLSGDHREQDIETSANAGAMGYLQKDASPEEIRDSIRLLDKGYTLLAPKPISNSKLVQVGNSFDSHLSGIVRKENMPTFLNVIHTEELLPNTTRWAEVGGLFLIASVATVAILSAVLEYKVVVKAPANVRPAGEIRLVQATLEGTVKSILVKENQVVNKEDIIATIDDSQLQIKKSQFLGNIQQNQMQLMQMDAQISAIDRQIGAETDRNQRAIASATADLQRTQREYQQTKFSVKGQLQEVQANIKIAQNELQKAEFELKSMQANLRVTEVALKTAKLKRDRYTSIATSGSISQNQLEEVQLGVEQQQQSLVSQKASLEGQKQVVERQKQAVAVAMTKYKPAAAAINPSNAVLAVVEGKIAQERATGEGSLARLKQEENSLIQRKIEIQNIINNSKKDLGQIEKQLQATVIRSPEKGTILKLDLRNPQQLVRPGEAIAQIAPSEAPLIVKANVSVEDISKVKVCKAQKVDVCEQGKVQMRISAYPYPDYGILLGAVRSISADVITPQTNALVPTAPYYEVTIEPEKRYLKKGDRSYPIQPGMEVKAEIISQQETFLTFILRKARLMTNV
jgi:multidrug efflux pump subunit AcrA (membrane-fusion protein)/DNA-binding NarL/FixJ family response regulator